jgi:peptidoglycan/xylan/chitin deacetylase (PgdA/CDA1 family)
MSLGDAVTRLADGELDRSVAVITFDDGFRSVHDLAFPVLREFDAPATVFLVTGLVDTDDTVWFCRINQAVSESDRNVLGWDGTQFDLGSARAKTATSASIQERLKRFPQTRLIDEVEWIVRELGGEPKRPIGQDSPFRILGREMIATMATSGFVEFGAHTVSHAILGPLTAPERRLEIGPSLAAVAQVTGQPCDLFAYPNGRPIDYDDETIRLLREFEVRAAVTTIEGTNDPSTPALELKRIGIGPETTLRDFAAMLQVPDVVNDGRSL